MRLLHFSDLGVDARSGVITSADADRAEVRAAFQRICALARELEVDAVCCAGNLYDDATATDETAEFLRAGFRELDPIPVFIAPGSTDPYHPGSLYGRAGYWSANVQIFTEADLAPARHAGVTLWGAAHTAPSQARGFVDGFEVDGPGPHIALFHGCEAALADALMTAPFTAAQINRAGLDHALVGHITVAHSAAEYTYPGRAAPRREADRTGGGAVLVTIDAAGSVLRRWHDLMPTVPEPHLRGGAEASAPAWVAQLFDPVPGQRDDLDEIARERTVRGEFVRHVRRANLAEDEEPVLRAGLLAIEGQLRVGGL